MTETTTTTWAEAGNWGEGSAVVIMRGEYEDGILTERPTVLADVPIDSYTNDDEVAATLETLGYREDRAAQRGFSDYGIIISLEVNA